MQETSIDNRTFLLDSRTPALSALFAVAAALLPRSLLARLRRWRRIPHFSVSALIRVATRLLASRLRRVRVIAAADESSSSSSSSDSDSDSSLLLLSGS
jgi:hypothetical protein